MTDVSPVSQPDHDRCDILIVGAGPAGLSFALSLRGLGLDVRMIEKADAASLVDPAYDGREIALSLRSVEILTKIGAWNHIASEEISPLNTAKVLDGRLHPPLHFSGRRVGEDRLGYFVANSVIRRALYAEHAAQGEAALIDNAEMVSLSISAKGGTATLADGRKLRADLIVGADTRFSTARRLAGVSATQHDFGRTMMVSKVRFEKPHGGEALECFLDGGSLAILPLNNQEASLVQTFAPMEAERQMKLDLDDYLDTANARIKHRFGEITSLSERFAYPLVGVYANEFARPGFAVIGDAAVGMHPITAHGFNLGVQGQAILADEIRASLLRGNRVADDRALTAYENQHRRLSRGLYWSTLAIAELSGRDSLPVKLARRALLDVVRLPPIRKMVVKNLTQPLSS